MALHSLSRVQIQKKPPGGERNRDTEDMTTNVENVEIYVYSTLRLADRNRRWDSPAAGGTGCRGPPLVPCEEVSAGPAHVTGLIIIAKVARGRQSWDMWFLSPVAFGLGSHCATTPGHAPHGGAPPASSPRRHSMGVPTGQSALGKSRKIRVGRPLGARRVGLAPAMTPREDGHHCRGERAEEGGALCVRKAHPFPAASAYRHSPWPSRRRQRGEPTVVRSSPRQWPPPSGLGVLLGSPPI